MIDYKRCVDEIRFFLQSDHPADERVRSAAREYIDACRKVNDRLRQCEGCLRQRHYAEAVHFAEVEPRLLELYAILEVIENLDYEERQHWEAFLHAERIERPPALLRHVALELNQAYLQVQPMEELFRRHRLLAWGKAPLKDRLAVMRELARLNPNNHQWNEDVRSFERERLKELETEVDTAIRQGNAATVQQLLAEVDGVPWLTPPPPTLKSRLEQTGQTMDRAQKVPRLERDLLQAWAATDAVRVRHLRDELSRVIGPPGGADPTWRRVQPALNWLQADEAFQDGVAKLREMLESNASEKELYRWYDYLHEFGRPLPEWLENMFETRVLEMRGSSFDRKVLFLVVGVVVFLILVGGVVAFILRR
jgi:hypothetical protein